MKRFTTLICSRDLSREGRKNYFRIFTILFILFAGWTFASFLVNRHSLIGGNLNFSSDGLKQHYVALVYIGRWLRTILKTLWQEHRLEIPLWDYNIGYGSDILTTLNYYGLGDPLKLVSVLIPPRFVEYYYSFLCVLYLYLSGITFSAYCMHRHYARPAILAGSFCYMFSIYAVSITLMHPFFLYGMIYMPLLLIGADRIMEGKRPGLFVGIVFLTSVTNFYVLYWMVFGLAGYVLIRLISDGRSRQIGKFLLRFLLFGLCGVSMAAVILLPELLVLTGSHRASLRPEHGLLYHFSYYLRVILQYISPGVVRNKVNTVSYTAASFVAGLAFLTSRKRKTAWKAAYVAAAVMLFIPAASSVMNGFSYVNGRWMWLYLLLVSVVLVVEWDELLMMERRQIFWVVVCSLTYLALFCLITVAYRKASFLGIFFAAAVLLAAILAGKHPDQKQKWEIFLMGTIFLNLAVTTGIQVRSSIMKNHVPMGKAWSIVKSTETEAVRRKREEAPADALQRVEAWRPTLYNATGLLGVPETGFYWSVASSTVTDFQIDVLVNMTTGEYQKYNGLDARAYLLALVGAGTYVTAEDEDAPVPYGFEYQDTVEVQEGRRYRIYSNPDALPLGYTYDSVVREEDTENLGAVQKQELYLETAAVRMEGEESGLPGGMGKDTESAAHLVHQTEPVGKETLTQDGFLSHEIPVALESGKNVFLQPDGSYLVTRKNAELTIRTDPAGKNVERYLCIDGFEMQRMSTWELYQGNVTAQYNMEKFRELPQERQEKVKRVDRAYDPDYRTHNTFIIPINSDGFLTSFKYDTPRYTWYAGVNDFVVNLGSRESKSGEIVISFPERGIYRFDSLQVWEQPLSRLKQLLKERGEDVLENVRIQGNRLSGTLELDKEKLLFLAIGYDKGWKAYIDGKEVPVYQTNKIGMGIFVDAGVHEIEFRYFTRGLSAGMIVSMAGMLCGIFLLKYRRKKEKK